MVFAWSACAGDPHAIIIETVELAVGEYYGLAWGGTQVERFHVLAHRGTADGEVVIVSPDLAQPCSLGKVSGYQPLQPENGGKYVLGSPSPARIGVFDRLDADGRGRLGFVGLDCKRIALELLDILPSEVRRLQPTDLKQLSVAVFTRDGTLLFVDPWAKTQTTVAKEVSSLRAYPGGVWLIEGGQAVQRDLDGKELARYGSQVRELLPLSDGGDLAYVDARGIILRQKGKSTRISPDGCRLRLLSGFSPQALGYFSPCDSRSLWVHTRAGKEIPYDQEVDAIIAQDGRLLFTVNSTDSTALFMALGSDPADAVLLTELPPFHLDTFWKVSAGRLLLAARQADDTITLLTVDPAKPGGKASMVDEGVVGLSTDEGAMAVLKEDGAFSLRSRFDLHVLLRAKGVSRSGFRFAFGGSASALGYLRDVDPTTKLGQLELHFLSGEHFTLARDVREFREVWWPEPGILYAAGGSRPGIRFAHVDVPCEVTSDSPWACGF